MQRKNSFVKLIREKGYYIALGICALAVGISGYLFVENLETEEALSSEETSVENAAAVQRPELHSPIRESEAEAPVVVLETEPEESEAPESTDGETDETDKPAVTTLSAVSPLEGTLLLGYSMDKLSYNPTTRDWRVHNGVDIAAPAGSPVLAAADGVVLSIYEDDLLGRTVTLQHDGGYVTHYANLGEQVPVMAGDRVTAGQPIGAVGTSALVEVGSEPHLHFSVYRDNVPQDPERFLKDSGKLSD